jgi:hypothetical protein
VGVHRRYVLGAISTALISSSWAPIAKAQLPPQPRLVPHPDPALFQSGDLIWPKKPGAYVPYNSGTKNTPEVDRSRWRQERDEYIQQASSLPNLDSLTKKRIQLLRDMDYREFIAVYEGAQEPGLPGVYSGGSFYVGHVGILEVDSRQTPWVIEALLDGGVVRSSYAEWIAERRDQVVWLGRLAELDAQLRAKIIPEATREIGKPYNFWNFDLGDDNGFYCSKLVWFSIYRSLGFSVDGKDNPHRLLWLSPKQLLYSPAILRIFDPGPYANL